jgi:poly(3-hydroxybutyrate) depolymerase
VIRPRLLVLLALSFLVRPGGARAGTPGIKSFRSYVSPADGSARVYTIRTPAGYDGTSRLSAVLFLHGRGGSALSFQYPEYLDAADANGYVLVFWQGRFDPNGLLSSTYVDGANGIPDETDVLACLDDALSHFAIDPARVHLVGFSQGGKGALLVGLKNPDRFASITDGAGPTDAFEGQKWSPGFADFRDAAGGDPSAGGAVLARWFAQSPRFYLPAARNVPIALAHGTLDDVVPDSTSLFPYRNTHHVADTPGFSDEHGATPTLSELHAADPGGYAFVARYPAGVGHDELGVLDPASLFAFFAEKIAPARPSRVLGVAYEERERSFYWTRLARATPPDGRPAPFSAERLAQASIQVTGATGAAEAPPLVTIDLARAGVDGAQPFTLVLAGALAVRVPGVPQAARVLRDGNPIDGATIVDGTLSIPLANYGTTAPATIAVSTSPAPVLESDLLVPALVSADGINGAHFETELVLANLGAESAEIEALLLDGSGSTARLSLPPVTTRLFTSGALFAALGRPAGGAAPLRLRTLSGERPFASARVFNALPGGGTYGLSFAVARAGDSVIGPGQRAAIVGPRSDERMNVSLFAPFEAVVGSLTPTSTSGGFERLAFSLAPGERLQLNDVRLALPNVTLDVTSGRANAYATVISNSATNDPLLSPPLPYARAATSWTLPAVASAPGRNGATFSSDVAFAVPSGSPPVGIALSFLSHDGGSAAASLTLQVPQTLVLSDVLGALFPRFVPGYGAITVDASSPLLVSDVTRVFAPSGPASQDVACVPSGEEATSTTPVALVGLAESTAARTNVTLVNVGGPTVVTLRLVGENGDRGTAIVRLAPGEFRQLDSVASTFAGGPTNAAALVITPDAAGRIAASGARIDNVTNDATGLRPVPLAGR